MRGAGNKTDDKMLTDDRSGGERVMFRGGNL